MQDHLVERLPVQGAHGVDLEVGHEAGLAEGVAAGRVHRLDKGLEADLARQVFVHLLLVVVEVRLGLGVGKEINYLLKIIFKAILKEIDCEPWNIQSICDPPKLL